MITIARQDQLELMQSQLQSARVLVPEVQAMAVPDALMRVPVLRKEYVAGAFFEPGCMDLDVQGLHQGFLRGARSRGARIMTDAAVEAMSFSDGIWRVRTGADTFHAPIVINASGAWADTVAEYAGVRRRGLVPKRRTAFLVSVPAGMDVRTWPMVNDVAEEFYFKPDAGQLLVSPADATPTAAADVTPDDLDVAVGVDRLERATTMNVQRVARAWAGLRTFASDAVPVVGFDGDARGFFWLAGQGGYGIKTSPALSRACATLIRCGELPEDLTRLGITTAALSPDRLNGETHHNQPQDETA
jgi:D-arginine dehydrogenase